MGQGQGDAVRGGGGGEARGGRRQGEGQGTPCLIGTNVIDSHTHVSVFYICCFWNPPQETAAAASERLKEKAHEAKEAAKDKLEDVKEGAKEKWAETKDKADETWQAAKERTGEAWGRNKQQAHETREVCVCGARWSVMERQMCAVRDLTYDAYHAGGPGAHG